MEFIILVFAAIGMYFTINWVILVIDAKKRIRNFKKQNYASERK